jgi:hypothetical protein
MSMQLALRDLNTGDQKVYAARMPKTVAVYGAVVLFGIGLIAVQTVMHTANVAMLMGEAVTQAAP